MSETIELNTDEILDVKPKKKYPYNLNEEEQILLEKIRKENPTVPFHFILEFYVSAKNWTPEQHKLYQEGNQKELLKTFKDDGENVLKQIEDFEEMAKNLKPAEIKNFENARESDEYFKMLIEERDKKAGIKTNFEIENSNILQETSVTHKEKNNYYDNPNFKLSDNILAEYQNNINNLVLDTNSEIKSNTFITIE